jgi:hypothetical protein
MPVSTTPRKRPQKFTDLPLQINRNNMTQLRLPGEGCMLIITEDVGNTSPYQQDGKTNRKFLFEFDRKIGAHILRIPDSVYHLQNAALAFELLAHKNRLDLVVLHENGTGIAPEPTAPAKPGRVELPDNIVDKRPRRKIEMLAQAIKDTTADERAAMADPDLFLELTAASQRHVRLLVNGMKSLNDEEMEAVRDLSGEEEKVPEPVKPVLPQDQGNAVKMVTVQAPLSGPGKTGDEVIPLDEHGMMEDAKAKYTQVPADTTPPKPVAPTPVPTTQPTETKPAAPTPAPKPAGQQTQSKK